MAELLYRLGKAAARRAWVVISAWAVALALAAVAFVAFGGVLGSAITIPGTPTQQVSDRLQEVLPEAGGGSATIVFHTEDGEPLTDAQRADISAALGGVEEVDGVKSVTDPFETAQERADAEQQVADGLAQIDAAKQQIEDGAAQIEAQQAQLDTGQAQLDDGRAQLDAARAQAEAAGLLAQAQPQLDAQQAQLDAQQAQLDAGRAQLDAARADLEAGRTELAENERELGLARSQLEMAREFRTVSEDGTAAVAVVGFEVSTFEVPDEVKAAVVAAVEEAPVDGVQAEFSSDLVRSISGLVGPGEIIGVVVAGLVLLVMLGTLIAAGLPILSALIGVGVGALATLGLSGVVEMVSVTPILGVMLGLAVGIDYSLFILNRHRRQLREGLELHESIGLANGTSGNAVVFAGLTVIIALVALNVTGIGFLGLMGTVGAVCVLVAVLVAVTFTPALLGLVGHRVLTRRERRALGAGTFAASATAPDAPATAAERPASTWRAVVRAVVAIGVLLVVGLPALSLRLGLPDGSSEPVGSTQYRAYQVTEEKFGAGVNGPLLVVADLPDGLDEAAAQNLQVSVGEQLLAQQDVVAVVPIGLSEDFRVAAYQVVPVDGPSSVSTEDLVHHLRGLELDEDGATVSLGVAGQASGNIDVSEKLADALPLYLGIVVGLSLIILIVVFRSILVPVIGTLGFILSVFAALGGVVAIYQWGWLGDVFGVHAPGPVLSFLPTMLVGVLFGLAMDYQLFLVSGMREAYAHGASGRVAVRRGLVAGRAVVTAAAIIMISVFGGFVFSHLAMVRPIGFGLAFGVLVDAFVVRMTLVPALMHLVGDAAWWVPRWLDRILPNADIEGAALERRHHHEPAAEPVGTASR
ncbi:MMPL family transporter [Antribacter sp. KLBMP9083]|uniref:MMPL family transporter n=1 Tax=Antribacter soli TaxID=2910976 RepID=A0AA41QEU7_9MICO|nr:MMPL family transporter [Antribacter soli]MCF4121841.1 MMPL family transporter [Antribacter soli]